MKLRGFRVELAEIEKVLAQLGFQATVLVDNQQLLAFLVAKEIQMEKLRDKMRELLPYYMIPELIMCFLEIVLFFFDVQFLELLLGFWR